ncbi:RNA polymerase III RPC4-domain-containing protein [Cladorrhinum sp. PSN259]|nr:RNA polymerase III RPC4-domain-containing protein [Cladorrhinum sp. PSN259]
MPPKPTSRGRGRGRGGTARSASATAAISASTSASASQQSAPEGDAIDADPTPAPTALTPSDPRSAGATPAPVAAAKRFKPKAVRASEAERLRRAEEIEKAEALRDGQENKRLSRLRGRGGRGGRGRGNLMGRNFRSAPAAGPMSSGTYSFNGEGPAGTREYGIASGPRFSLVQGEGERRGGFKDPRINADTLYDYSRPYSYEPTTGDRKMPILPMGIRRLEHKTEGAVKTNEDEDAKEEENSDDEGLFVDDVKPSSSKTEDTGGYQAANSVRIKKEGGEDGMDVDLSQIPQGDSGVNPLAATEKKKPVVKVKGPKTPKEIEDELQAQDMARMMGVLSLSQRFVDGQVEAEARPRTELDGHMFHFQFPPVLPSLKPVAKEEVAIKPEIDDDEDVVMLDKGKGKASAVTVDLTKDIKMEEDGKDDEDDDDDNDDDDEGDYDLDQTGYVGKLIVRKSGRVELDWGGHRMEVGMGIEKSFFTSAVLIDIDEAKPEDPTTGAGVKDPQASAGVAFDMGRVHGSFTVASTWSPTKPWIVDPKDLEI